MIEINLIPDVKQELIRAERVRSVVISFSILIGIIVTSVLSLVFGLSHIPDNFTIFQIPDFSKTTAALISMISSRSEFSAIRSRI